MKRALAIVLAAGFALGCKEMPSPRKATPPTLEEASAFTKELVAAMSPCDEVALGKLIDSDVTSSRALVNTDLPSSAAASFRATASGKLGKVLCQLSRGGKAVHLRTQLVAGAPRPLLRIVGDIWNYYELELDKHRGKVLVVDLYTYATGEQLSEMLGNVIGLARGSAQSVTTINTIKQLMVEGKPEAAHAAFESLPPKVRNTRSVMLIAIAIAQQRSEEEYRTSLDAFAAAFPDDPSLDLTRIQLELLHERFDNALAAIDRLDQRIGGDPYLDVARSDVLNRMGKLDQALASARRATEREPTLVDAWMELFAQQAATKDFKGAVATLGILRDRFETSVDREVFGSSDMFAGFFASPEYEAWLAAQPE